MRRAIALLLVAAACSSPTEGAVPAHDDREAYERGRRPDRLIAALALRPGMRVADIGAGAGWLEPHLARAIAPGGRLVATDIDADALAALRARADAAGIAVEARQVAADQHGLEPGAYDLVLLAEVDHLLPEPGAYLRRLATALAPGGRIAIANRVYREAGARAAARAAGLTVERESRALPAQFVVVLRPGGD